MALFIKAGAVVFAFIIVSCVVGIYFHRGPIFSGLPNSVVVGKPFTSLISNDGHYQLLIHNGAFCIIDNKKKTKIWQRGRQDPLSGTIFSTKVPIKMILQPSGNLALLDTDNNITGLLNTEMGITMPNITKCQLLNTGYIKIKTKTKSYSQVGLSTDIK